MVDICHFLTKMPRKRSRSGDTIPSDEFTETLDRIRDMDLNNLRLGLGLLSCVLYRRKLPRAIAMSLEQARLRLSGSGRPHLNIGGPRPTNKTLKALVTIMSAFDMTMEARIEKAREALMLTPNEHPCLYEFTHGGIQYLGIEFVLQQNFNGMTCEEKAIAQEVVPPLLFVCRKGEKWDQFSARNCTKYICTSDNARVLPITPCVQAYIGGIKQHKYAHRFQKLLDTSQSCLPTAPRLIETLDGAYVFKDVPETSTCHIGCLSIPCYWSILLVRAIAYYSGWHTTDAFAVELSNQADNYVVSRMMAAVWFDKDTAWCLARQTILTLRANFQCLQSSIARASVSMSRMRKWLHCHETLTKFL